MKVIKEFNINNLTYRLSYIVWRNKVYPRVEILKDEELLSGGYSNGGTSAELFGFSAYNSSSYVFSYFGTIKEMFTELRKYNDIPEYIEKEYEEIFLIYKLNDFNEI